MPSGIQSFGQNFANAFLAARQARSQREESRLDRQLQQEALDLRRELGTAQLDMQRQQQDLQERRFQLEQKQADGLIVDRFQTALSANVHPRAKVFILDQIASRMGIDPKKDAAYKDVRDLLTSLPAEQARALSEGMTAAYPGLPPGQVQAIVKGMFAAQVDPIEIMKRLEQLSTRQGRQAGSPLGGAAPGPQPNRLLQPESLMTSGGMATGGGAAPAEGLMENPAELNREAFRLYREADAASRRGDDQHADNLRSQADGLRQLATDIRSGRADEARLQIEQREASAKAAEREASRQTQAQIVVDNVDRAISLIEEGGEFGEPVAGIGEFIARIPGTAARDLRETLKTIGGNIAFDKLQQMRAESKTGAALGSVSDFEGQLLRGVFSSLDQGQRPELLVENLRVVQRLYLDIINGGAVAQLGKLVRDGVISEAEAMQQAQEALGLGDGGASSALPEGVTEEDVQFTMRKHGLTREQVLERIQTDAP